MLISVVSCLVNLHRFYSSSSFDCLEPLTLT